MIEIDWTILSDLTDLVFGNGYNQFNKEEEISFYSINKDGRDISDIELILS